MLKSSRTQVDTTAAKQLRRAHLVAKFLVLFVLFPAISSGETFCVHNEEELLAALAKSSNNGEDDALLLMSGVSASGLSMVRETGFSLRVEGGYDAECSIRREALSPSGQDERNANSEISPQEIPAPQQSTTGPIPPEGITPLKEDSLVFPGTSGGTMQTLGVPGYAWRHGCGPTAIGMVAGYYDLRGYADLFPGAANTQTDSVNQGIASQRSAGDPGHYEDYSQPIDNGGTGLLSDKSQTPSGDEHVSDSIADFMQTSWSSRSNYYGWSWSSDVTPSFLNYVNLKNTSYSPSSTGYYMYNSSLTWSVLVNEINNNRPMVFLVDTDGDGYTDHFVTVVGYRNEPVNQYGCLDTWYPYNEVRWCDFRAIGAGNSWGVYGGWSFSLAQLAPQVTTNDATFIDSDAAQLNGTVDPNGRETTYWFEYGQTTSYGLTTATFTAGSGTEAVAVNSLVSGLLPDSVYHFRLVADDGVTRVNGGDKSFKTIKRSVLTPIFFELLLD